MNRIHPFPMKHSFSKCTVFISSPILSRNGRCICHVVRGVRVCTVIEAPYVLPYAARELSKPPRSASCVSCSSVCFEWNAIASAPFSSRMVFLAYVSIKWLPRGRKGILYHHRVVERPLTNPNTAIDSISCHRNMSMHRW